MRSIETTNHAAMFRYLAVLTVASTAGLQIWRALFNNFAVEAAGLEGHHIGIIQSIREIPGFLALLAVYVVLLMREHRMAAVSVLLLGAGVGATGLLPSFGGLIFTTVLMSFGFHFFETANQSLTLQYFNSAVSPWVFGKQRSFAAATSVVTAGIIFLLEPYLSYPQLYFGLGSLVIAASLWGLTQHPVDEDLTPQHKKMIFKRRYWLYYSLTFMAGARRQIFVAFALFLMVKIFDFSVREITLLFIANNTINYFLSPWIGRAITRYGERSVLSLEYISLVFIFIGYAFTQTKWVLGLLYILDHIFFNFSIAIRTYFQKVGDPRDIAPTMAMGFTINHIAAVVLPFLGGLVWMVDYRIVFVSAAAMSLISLLLSRRIPLSGER